MNIWCEFCVLDERIVTKFRSRSKGCILATILKLIFVRSALETYGAVVINSSFLLYDLGNSQKTVIESDGRGTWNIKLMQIIYKNSVSTSPKTHSITSKKFNSSVLFRESIVVCYGNHGERMRTLMEEMRIL